MHKIALLIVAILCSVASARRPVHNSTAIDYINGQKKGWRAGVNDRFKDISIEEATSLLGLGNTPVSEDATPQARSLSRQVTQSTIPSEYDFRTEYPQCIQTILDQAACGGCWAFAASSVFGARYCRLTGVKNPTFSPQYPISCATNANGCGGGTLPAAWDFFKTNGEVTAASYPYTSGSGSSGTCSVSSSATKYYSSSYTRPSTVSDMQLAIMNGGPIQVGFNVYSDFFQYKSGVYSYTTGSFAGGHSVYFVGWGEDGYGTPYWIAVNSWGASWGNSGTFYIKRGVNMVGIETGYRPVAPIITAPTTTTTRASTTTRAPTTTTTTRTPTTTAHVTTTTTTRAPTTTTTLAPTESPISDRSCSSGWSKFGNSCYLVNGALATWNSAKASCNALGSSLAEIQSEAENSFLLTLNSRNLQSAWLGLSAVNGVIVNNAGHIPSFTYWRPDISTSSGCVVQIRDTVSSNVGKWKTETCTAARIYVCKKDL